MSKKLKESLFMLILYFVVFGAVVLIKFPKTSNELLKIETDGIVSVTGDHLKMVDKVKTDKSASIHYLLQDSEGNHFIVSATRFPFLPRYDLSEIMSLSKDEIYKTSDYYNQITIIWEGNSLELKVVKKISGSVFLLLFLLFVTLVNVISAYQEQKASLNNRS